MRYENALRILLKHQNVNSCIVLFTPQMMLNIESLADVIIKIKQEFKEKPIVSCIMAVTEMEASLRNLDEINIPQYSFPESAARSISTMQTYKGWITRPRTDIQVFEVDRASVSRLFAKVKSQQRNYVS